MGLRPHCLRLHRPRMDRNAVNINQIIYSVGMITAIIMAVGFDQPVAGIVLAIHCGFTETIRVLTHIARGTQP